MAFDKEKIKELYPEAVMYESMLIHQSTDASLKKASVFWIFVMFFSRHCASFTLNRTPSTVSASPAKKQHWPDWWKEASQFSVHSWDKYTSDIIHRICCHLHKPPVSVHSQKRASDHWAPHSGYWHRKNL